MIEEGPAERIAYHIECEVDAPGHGHEVLTLLYREGCRVISMHSPACQRHETLSGSMTYVPPLAIGPDELPRASAPLHQAEIEEWKVGGFFYPVACFRCVVCDELVLLTGKPQPYRR